METPHITEENMIELLKEMPASTTFTYDESLFWSSIRREARNIGIDIRIKNPNDRSGFIFFTPFHVNLQEG